MCVCSDQVPMSSATTLITILRATLRTIERSPEVPSGSAAVQKLREGIDAVIEELEPIAQKEPRFEPRTGADLYARR